MSHNTPAPDQSDTPMRDRVALSTAETAIYTGLAVPTLKKYRTQGTGPRYTSIGSKIMYRPSDLDEYIAKHLIGGDR